MTGETAEAGQFSRISRPAFRLGGRLIPVRAGEMYLVMWSFAYFFALMCGYYLLKPLRDEMAVVYGPDKVQWLFTATFVCALAASLVFGWLASRLPRQRLPRMIYLSFLLQLLLFFAGFRLGAPAFAIAPVFFVWLGVFNLFVVSVFWSFMADTYTTEQGKRLFGFIAAGGGLGTLAGPAIAAGIAGAFGPVSLLPVAAGFLAFAILAMGRLAEAGRPGMEAGPAPANGGALDGFVLTVRSPFLRLLGLFVSGSATLSTLLYFQQIAVVSGHFPAPGERTAFFASVDLAVNGLSVVLQIALSGRVMRRAGIAVTLAAVPLLGAIGFTALALSPGFPLLVAVMVVHRAGNFTLLRPGKEVLFTTLDRASRYKAKCFLDTVAYRGSDAMGAWLAVLVTAIGYGPAAVAAVGVPVALLLTRAGFVLGRTHDRKE